MAYKRTQKKTVAKKVTARKAAPIVAKIETPATAVPKKGTSPVAVFGLMFTLLIAMQTSLFGFVSMPKPAAPREAPKVVVTPEAVTATTPIALPPIEPAKKPDVRAKKKAATR